MIKFVSLYLFLLVFISVSTASNGFALKNVQIQKHVIILAESGDSNDEESMLEEEQELLEKNEQNENNDNIDKMTINPDDTKNEIDPGFILGAPEGIDSMPMLEK